MHTPLPLCSGKGRTRLRICCGARCDVNNRYTVLPGFNDRVIVNLLLAGLLAC